MSLCFFGLAGSDSAGNFARTEAMSAHIDVLRGAVDDRLHALHVGLPGAVGTTMGVGDLDAEGDALVAEFAFGHVAYLLAMRIAFQKASTDIITDIPAECKHFFQKLATKKF